MARIVAAGVGRRAGGAGLVRGVHEPGFCTGASAGAPPVGYALRVLAGPAGRVGVRCGDARRGGATPVPAGDGRRGGGRGGRR